MTLCLSTLTGCGVSSNIEYRVDKGDSTEEDCLSVLAEYYTEDIEVEKRVENAKDTWLVSIPDKDITEITIELGELDSDGYYYKKGNVDDKVLEKTYKKFLENEFKPSGYTDVLIGLNTVGYWGYLTIDTPCSVDAYTYEQAQSNNYDWYGNARVILCAEDVASETEIAELLLDIWGSQKEIQHKYGSIAVMLVENRGDFNKLKNLDEKSLMLIGQGLSYHYGVVGKEFVNGEYKENFKVYWVDEEQKVVISN